MKGVGGTQRCLETISLTPYVATVYGISKYENRLRDDRTDSGVGLSTLAEICLYNIAYFTIILFIYIVYIAYTTLNDTIAYTTSHDNITYITD